MYDHSAREIVCPWVVGGGGVTRESLAVKKVLFFLAVVALVVVAGVAVAIATTPCGETGLNVTMTTSSSTTAISV